MADGCRSVASIIDLVWRERPSSRQLLGEAWRAPGLDGCYCEKLAEEVAAYYRPVKCQSALLLRLGRGGAAEGSTAETQSALEGGDAQCTVARAPA